MFVRVSRLLPLAAVFLLLGTDTPESCAPPGIPCGDQVCTGNLYCQVTYPGVYGAETSYDCVEAPEACQGDALTCDCLVATEACPEMVAWCDDDGNGPVCSIAMP